MYKILIDKLGFICCDIDQSVFYKVTGYKLTIILVYVDDCIIVATSIRLVNWMKDSVKKFVEIMDLGEIHWLLDIELKRDCEASKLMLSQQLYISASLHWFGLEDIKPVSISMDPTL